MKNLEKQLKEMGIPVVAGKVKKSDIRKVLHVKSNGDLLLGIDNKDDLEKFVDAENELNASLGKMRNFLRGLTGSEAKKKMDQINEFMKEFF